MSWEVGVRACGSGRVLAAVLALWLVGCSSLVDPSVPNPIGRHLEPYFDSEYLLYRPSAYDRRDAWPLLVVCHGGFPDSPSKQIRLWTRLAERYGFILAAPTMPRPRRGWSTDETDRAEDRELSRQHIVSVIKHIRAAHTVSRDRIFIHGSGTGAQVAIDAGMGRPDLFRAVSVVDPNVDEALLTSIEQGVDPHQPVLVARRATGVLTGKHAERCIDWLRKRHVDVKIESTTSDQDTDAQRIIEFYETVIRSKPWLRIETAADGGHDPMSVRFALVGTHDPGAFRWDFGDGDTSTVAEPIHRFRQTGIHRVTVIVDGPNGAELTRITDVAVPVSPIKPIGAVPDEGS